MADFRVTVEISKTSFEDSYTGVVCIRGLHDYDNIYRIAEAKGATKDEAKINALALAVEELTKQTAFHSEVIEYD